MGDGYRLAARGVSCEAFDRSAVPGRYRAVEQTEIGRRRGVHRVVKGLQPPLLVQLTFVPASLYRLNDCLVSVITSMAAARERLQPLQSGHFVSMGADPTSRIRAFARTNQAAAPIATVSTKSAFHNALSRFQQISEQPSERNAR